MKRILKNIAIAFSVTALILTSPFALQNSSAHSGRTDANGGHHDYKNISGLGSYHFHCGGHPAHLHPNGVCPYKKGNKTNVIKYKKIKFQKSLTTQTGTYISLKLNSNGNKINWKSSNKKVASISKNGEVVAKKAGTTIITAKYNNTILYCHLKVLQAPPFSIEIYDWDFHSRQIKFKIKNTSKKTLTISSACIAYDDDYNYYTTMKNKKSVKIKTNKTKIIVYSNFTFPKSITYYAQRYMFKVKLNGKTRRCYAEYTYDYDIPFDFSLDKPYKNNK